jgi:nitronate monooxygenase
MSLATELTQKLRIEHPIFQAPMAGGGDTAELVASVCNGGALGFIGAAYLTPVWRAASLRQISLPSSF